MAAGAKRKLIRVSLSVEPRGSAELDDRSGDPILVWCPTDCLRTCHLRLGGIGKSAAADLPQGQILPEESRGNGEKADETREVGADAWP